MGVNGTMNVGMVKYAVSTTSYDGAEPLRPRCPTRKQSTLTTTTTGGTSSSTDCCASHVPHAPWAARFKSAFSFSYLLEEFSDRQEQKPFNYSVRRMACIFRHCKA
jgi:hypothetical protein